MILSLIASRMEKSSSKISSSSLVRPSSTALGRVSRVRTPSSETFKTSSWRTFLLPLITLNLSMQQTPSLFLPASTQAINPLVSSEKVSLLFLFVVISPFSSQKLRRTHLELSGHLVINTCGTDCSECRLFPLDETNLSPCALLWNIKSPQNS